jgi:hypothetical protein
VSILTKYRRLGILAVGHVKEEAKLLYLTRYTCRRPRPAGRREAIPTTIPAVEYTCLRRSAGRCVVFTRMSSRGCVGLGMLATGVVLGEP